MKPLFAVTVERVLPSGVWDHDTREPAIRIISFDIDEEDGFRSVHDILEFGDEFSTRRIVRHLEKHSPESVDDETELAQHLLPMAKGARTGKGRIAKVIDALRNSDVGSGGPSSG